MMDDDRTDGTFHRVCESGHTRDSSTETNFSAARSIHRTMASLTEKLSTSKQTKEEKEEWGWVSKSSERGGVLRNTVFMSALLPVKTHDEE